MVFLTVCWTMGCIQRWRGTGSSHCPVPHELNWEHWDPVPSVSPCYTLVRSVEAHTTQTPWHMGGIPCHHVHPWALRGAQRLCQALLIGHIPCPTQRRMEPGREPVMVTWLWGSPAPWQDTQHPTIFLQGAGLCQEHVPGDILGRMPLCRGR